MRRTVTSDICAKGSIGAGRAVGLTLPRHSHDVGIRRDEWRRRKGPQRPENLPAVRRKEGRTITSSWLGSSSGR
jgi:hypothetical protein